MRHTSGGSAEGIRGQLGGSGGIWRAAWHDNPGLMPGDAHLHNAAATLRDILTRRQPEYRWDVDVLPRHRDPSGDHSAGSADLPTTPRPTDAGPRGSSENDGV
jgi:hypothetical protein